MPTSRPRARSRFRLDVSQARTVPIRDEPPLLPWPVAALGGGVVAALAGLIAVCGMLVIAWLGASAVPLASVLAVGTQVWLLGNGGQLTVAGLQLGLVPLGLTLILLALAGSIGAFAYQQGNRARPSPAVGADAVRLVLGTAAQFALGYLLVAALAAWLAGSELVRCLPPAFAVGLLGAALGAGWRSGYRPRLPGWVRPAFRGAAAGLLTLVLVSAVVLGVALVQGENRIAGFEQAIGFDTGGYVAWSLACLLYLPTLLSWAASWLLVAGFTVGDGSLVAAWVTQLGMLPVVPVFGALPETGVGGLEGWLAVGPVVGLVAGVVAVRGRIGELSAALGTGSAAGLLTGLGFLVWALAGRGGLGTDRFAVVGPRWPEVLIGVGVLLAGAAVGSLVTWLVQTRLRRRS